MARPSVARVLPANVRHNVRRVRALAPHSKVMACVKADGYGHGIVTVAKAIEKDVNAFAVATIEEALELRHEGLKKPILLLEGPHSAAEVAESHVHNLWLCLSTFRQLEWLEASREKPDCWLKIDSGMHRLGFPAEDVNRALTRIRTCLGDAYNPVLCSHFACADEPNNPMTDRQVQAYDDAVTGTNCQQSLANSAAILSRADTHRDWVRPGYMLYGGSPFKDRSAADLDLRPAMELTAEIISVRKVATGESVGYGGTWTAARDSQIATIAIGYGDGYPRHARNGTPVIIDGHTAALAGRVSMDMITVDVTDLPTTPGPGSSAQLWGRELSVDQIGACANTIGYELLAGMPRRIPRRVENP